MFYELEGEQSPKMGRGGWGGRREPCTGADSTVLKLP